MNTKEEEILQAILKGMGMGATEIKEMITARELYGRIYKVWKEFPLDTDVQKERAKIVWNHVHNLLKDVYKEELSDLKLYKSRIKNYEKEIKELRLALQMPPFESTAVSLITQEEDLRKELATRTEEKTNRCKTFQDLKNEELILCQKLAMPEHAPPSNKKVPSLKDISELEEHVKTLREEKERREKKFEFARKELLIIHENCEIVPGSPLEDIFIHYKDITTLTLNDDTFKALEEVLSKAQRQKEWQEVNKNMLVEELTTLWKSLKVEDDKRNEFLSNHTNCRLSTIYSIEQEVEKCRAIDSGNMEHLITDTRTELGQLWEKCFVSQSDKELFHHFYSPEMSIEVYEAHEKEVDKWKTYFSEVEHILKKIHDRTILWDRLEILEEAAKDPNRFFRKSQINLLDAFKERVKLIKDLPVLESETFKEIDELKNKKGITFLYKGEDFKTHVESQRAEKKQNKGTKKDKQSKVCVPMVDKDKSFRTPLKRAKSVNFATSPPPKLLRSKTVLYKKDNVKTPTPNKFAKGSNNKLNESVCSRKSAVQQKKEGAFATPLKKTAIKDFAKTAPSKMLSRVLKTMSPIHTPTSSRVVPNTVSRMVTKTSIRPQKK